jgi:DNA-directed RNA polymerase specialized sigma24 family protein
MSDRLEHARAVCRLAAWIDALPANLRIALQLAYVEGLTPTELGEVLEIGPKQACALVREGLTLLIARTKVNQDAPTGSA